MSFIDIPKGKTEIRMSDGNWVKIPEGVTQVDSTKLWSEDKQPEPMFGNEMLNVVGGQNVKTGKVIDDRGLTIPEDGSFTAPSFDTASEVHSRNEALLAAIGKSQVSGDPTAVDPSTREMFNIEGIGAEPTYMAMDLVNPALKVAGGLAGAYGAYKVGKGAIGAGKRIAESPSEAMKISAGFIDEAPTLKAGLTPREQTMANVDIGGQKTIGVYEQAIQEGGDDARRALGKNLASKQKAIDIASRKNDIEEVSKVSSRMYDDMVKVVSRDNKSVYDATSLADDLEVIGSITARSDKSERTIKTLQDTLSKNKNLSLEQALDFRKDINAELANATGDTYKNWKRMKDNVDGFIKKNTDSSLHGFIEDTIQTYSRAKKNEELVEIIGKNKFDYQKTLDEIKRANISSPEVETSVDILSQFADKFKNDKAISSMVSTKGSDKAGSAILTVMSGIVNQITGFIAKGAGLQRGKNVIVQGNVLKEVLAKSKSPEEFITKVSKMTETPKDIEDRLLKHLKSTRQSHKSKEPAREVVNTDIERSLRKSQRDRNQAQNTMDKAQDVVNRFDDEIMDLDIKIDRAIENNKPTSKLRERKAKIETRLKRAEADLSIKTDKHSESATKFDKELESSGYEIDEMGKFKNPTEASKRSDVSVSKKDLP